MFPHKFAKIIKLVNIKLLVVPTPTLCVNNLKERFKVEEVEDFSENLPDALPLLLDVASKDITISIIGVKSVGSYGHMRCFVVEK